MRYYIVFFLCFIFYSCSKKSDTDNVDNLKVDDALTEEQLKIISKVREIKDFPIENVLLPNGKTIKEFYNGTLGKFSQSSSQDQINLLISKLSINAHKLNDKSNFQYPYEGVNKPSQNGIAYSWGGKNHLKRQKPPGYGTVCNHEIYGLDCSGFIFQIFKMSGVDFIIGPSNSQRKPKTIKDAITASNPELKDFDVSDLGKISLKDIQTGDIIYWKPDINSRANHIGIILEDENGRLAIFQSNGYQGKNQTQCQNNLSLASGVRTFDLIKDANIILNWFGSQTYYGIVRITSNNISQNPQPVFNPTPPHNSTNIPVNGKFSFIIGDNTPKNAIFKLYLDIEPNPKKPHSLSGPIRDYSGLKPKTTYYWKVETLDNNNSGAIIATSSVWKFTTK